MSPEASSYCTISQCAPRSPASSRRRSESRWIWRSRCCDRPMETSTSRSPSRAITTRRWWTFEPFCSTRFKRRSQERWPLRSSCWAWCCQEAAGGRLGSVPYEPGSREVPSDAEKRIRSLARVAAEKPELVLRASRAHGTGGSVPPCNGGAPRKSRGWREPAGRGRCGALRHAPHSSCARERKERRSVRRRRRAPAAIRRGPGCAPDELERLALERAAALRDSLVATGVPPEALEIGAPRIGNAPEVVLALHAAREASPPLRGLGGGGSQDSGFHRRSPECAAAATRTPGRAAAKTSSPVESASLPRSCSSPASGR